MIDLIIVPFALRKSCFLKLASMGNGKKVVGVRIYLTRNLTVFALKAIRPFNETTSEMFSSASSLIYHKFTNRLVSCDGEISRVVQGWSVPLTGCRVMHYPVHSLETDVL